MCQELLDGHAEHWLCGSEVDLKRAFVLGCCGARLQKLSASKSFLKVEAAHVCALGGCGVGVWGGVVTILLTSGAQVSQTSSPLATLDPLDPLWEPEKPSLHC